MDLTNFIKELNIQENQSKRLDCPICNGKYCFSVSSVNGELLYHCFRASCGSKGRIKEDVKIDTIRDYNRGYSNNDLLYNSCYIIPNHFTSPLQNPKSLSFLRYWNLLNFYARGLELYYDPKMHRIVFPLRNLEKELKGATGRSLAANIQPKWYIYERNNECPFIISKGISDSCVIVEDPISCVICTNISNSISLLGTNVPNSIGVYIRPFSKIYIALDDDATFKSLKLQKELNLYKPTYIIPLRKDLKYFNNQELQELRKEYRL